MRLRLRKPTQALDKAYAKQSITQDRMDAFRGALTRLFARVNENESEDYQQTIVAEFLGDAFYSSGPFALNTQEPIDIVIQSAPAHPEGAPPPMPRVFIETRKVFAGEMMTTLKNNVRALHELILYYFDERDRQPNLTVSQLIVTDVYNWFFFDEHDFRTVFYNNAKLRKLYQLKQQQKKDNTFFYGETARILRELDEEIPVTCLNLREIADALHLPAQQGNPVLIPVFKLFSPQHLLNAPFPNDATDFNRRFYEELLHLIGLRETTLKKNQDRNRPRVQRLPEGERLDGSLLEQTINQLRANNVLTRLAFPEQYGDNETDQLTHIGLELCITWLNRLLFFKFTENQLAQYHRMADHSVNQPGSLLSARFIHSFQELNRLLLAVSEGTTGQQPDGRSSEVPSVPHLACALFELTDLERSTIQLDSLTDAPELPLFAQTILAEQTLHLSADPALQPQQPTLQYLLAFLNAYEFLADDPAEVRPTDKPLITAEGISLTLAKLTNNPSNSSPTSGITAASLVRDSIRQAVVTRFNEHAVTPDKIDSIEELASILSQYNNPDDLLRFNAIFNSLRIVDPCVGSGQFLVSALNELMALKARLGILCDQSGHPLRQYAVSLVGQDVIITDEANQPFQYYAPVAMNEASDLPYSFPSSPAEVQRVQETLFQEKRTLIQNCLFGVDNDPVTVSICRLRLWLELLKNAYLVAEGQKAGAMGVESEGPIKPILSRISPTPLPQTLSPSPSAPPLSPFPNLDLTVRAGDALIGQLTLAFRADGVRNQSLRDRFLPAFSLYRADVLAYKHSSEETERKRLRPRLQAFDQYMNELALIGQKDYVKIRQLEAKLAQSALPFDRTGGNDQQQTQSNLLMAKKAAFAKKQRLFRRAFEWRYAFPEVLDEVGTYVGFDVVIGQPPITRLTDVVEATAYFRHAFPNTYARSAALYVLFIERGLSLLRPGGQLAFLLPTKGLLASHAAKLRQWLKTKATEPMAELDHEPSSGASPANTCILTVRHTDPSHISLG